MIWMECFHDLFHSRLNLITVKESIIVFVKLNEHFVEIFQFRIFSHKVCNEWYDTRLESWHLPKINKILVNVEFDLFTEFSLLNIFLEPGVLKKLVGLWSFFVILLQAGLNEIFSIFRDIFPDWSLKVNFI